MGINILIVDDSSFARSFVKRALDNCDLESPTYFEANSVKEALEKLKNNNIDFIFSDLNMPDQSGQDLLIYSKANSLFCEIPFVVITSLKNEQRERELIGHGAMAILDKPINQYDLKKVVQQKLNIVDSYLEKN